MQLQTIQLTSGASEVFEPSISPDGNQVAFAMKVQDEVHIFTVPVEGGTPRQITYTNISNRSPVWSPDGRRIAYVIDYGGTSKIAVIDAKGGVPKFFELRQYVGYLVWHPGRQILYLRSSNCGLLDPDSGTQEQLLRDDINGYVTSPSYSQDGRKVALTATKYEGDWHLRGRTKKELAIYSVDDHSMLWSIPLDPGTGLLGWSYDGIWLYLATLDVEKTAISRRRIADGRTEIVYSLPWSDVWGMAMGSNCSTFVCVRGKRQSDIWLIESFDPDVR